MKRQATLQIRHIKTTLGSAHDQLLDTLKTQGFQHLVTEPLEKRQVREFFFVNHLWLCLFHNFPGHLLQPSNLSWLGDLLEHVIKHLLRLQPVLSCIDLHDRDEELKLRDLLSAGFVSQQVGTQLTLKSLHILHETIQVFFALAVLTIIQAETYD
jgi:hypothetical protein